MEEKKVYWFKELQFKDIDLAGKKCANMGELINAGWNVPAGFAITLDAYEQFLMDTNLLREIRDYLHGFEADTKNPEDMAKYEELSEKIRGDVESKKMPEDLKDDIVSHYQQLCKDCGIENVPVSIRTSGTPSYVGKDETYLQVTGNEEVLEAIIKTWGSTYSTSSLIARDELCLPLAMDKIGVAVYKMVNAKCNGMISTVDPENGDISKIVINGNWGYGKSALIK